MKISARASSLLLCYLPLTTGSDEVEIRVRSKQHADLVPIRDYAFNPTRELAKHTLKTHTILFPTQYNTYNGDSNPSQSFWDDTYNIPSPPTEDHQWLSGGIGDLTDGIKALDRGALENPTPYVAWKAAADVTFYFEDEVLIDDVKISVDDSDDGSVCHPNYAIINQLVYPFPPNPNDGGTGPYEAHFILENPMISAQVHLILAQKCEWMAVSEVEFTREMSALTLSPASYSMFNGGDTGGTTVWDDTYTPARPGVGDYEWLSNGLGKLTDGETTAFVGGASWFDDSTKYVGWQGSDGYKPDITFEFERSVVINRVKIAVDDPSEVFFGNGVDVCAPQRAIIHNKVYDFPSNTGAGPFEATIELEEGVISDEIRVILVPLCDWVMVSEITFFSQDADSDGVPDGFDECPSTIPDGECGRIGRYVWNGEDVVTKDFQGGQVTADDYTISGLLGCSCKQVVDKLGPCEEGDCLDLGCTSAILDEWVHCNTNVTLTPSVSASPSLDSTLEPSSVPTKAMTSAPSSQPTNQPTKSTTSPTSLSSARPTGVLTSMPSREPTPMPTRKPITSMPSREPTHMPTRKPTPRPTSFPTKFESEFPSTFPSKFPTAFPTPVPTLSPTPVPTRVPTTKQPTNTPTSRTSDPTSKNNHSPNETPRPTSPRAPSSGTLRPGASHTPTIPSAPTTKSPSTLTLPCKPWCHSPLSPLSWDTTCQYYHHCSGCEECTTHNNSICREDFCNADARQWKDKCPDPRCGACHQCEEDLHSFPVCHKRWCESNKAPWQNKCDLLRCVDCCACDNTDVEENGIPVCQKAWCEEQKALGTVDDVCDLRQCGSCGECVDRVTDFDFNPNPKQFCHASCELLNFSWDDKCEMQICRGCSKCESEGPKCQTDWCNSGSETWEEKCLMDTCADCPRCYIKN